MNNRGASTIEYAIIAGLVGAASVVLISEKAAGHGVQVTMCKAASYIEGGDGSNCSGQTGTTTPPPADPPAPWQPNPANPYAGPDGNTWGAGNSDGCHFNFNYVTKHYDATADSASGCANDDMSWVPHPDGY